VFGLVRSIAPVVDNISDMPRSCGIELFRLIYPHITNSSIFVEGYVQPCKTNYERTSPVLIVNRRKCNIRINKAQRDAAYEIRSDAQ
jgi:hypothetical protein